MKRLAGLALIGAAAVAVIALGLRRLPAPSPVLATPETPPSKTEKELRAKLAAAERQAREIDEENAMLLKAIKETPKAKTPIRTLRASDVEPRLAAVRKRMDEKQFATALTDLKSIYEETAGAGGYAAICRNGLVLPLLGRLAREYPEARLTLTQIRDSAFRASGLSGNPDDEREAALSAISATRALGDDAFMLTWLDALSPEHPTRAMIARTATEFLANAGRYEDVLRVESASQMNVRLASAIQRGEASAAQPGTGDARRQQIVTRTALDIETLLGGKRLADAQALTRRLLAYDSSPATLANLRQRAERVGQSGFVDSLSSP